MLVVVGALAVLGLWPIPLWTYLEVKGACNWNCTYKPIKCNLTYKWALGTVAETVVGIGK